MPPRNRLAWFTAALAIAACAAYSVWIEPHWIQVTEHDLRRVPETERIRIVQLSDLHLAPRDGSWTDLVKAIEGTKPDLIILSGDVIDTPDALPLLQSFLSGLGGFPVIAVLGNWEHWSGVDLEALRAVYEQRPLTHLLVNRLVTMPIRNRVIHIGGLDDFTAGHPDGSALGRPPTEGAAVLVQHSPGFFEGAGAEASRSTYDLCLAGHTHGGQITLLGLPLWTPPGSGSFRSGFYKTPTCRLYVSRGLGTSILPIRFGARPEIAVFDL